MPVSGYLTTISIENILVFMAKEKFPSICDLIVLPERSHEQRTSRAIRIGKPPGDAKRGVLFIGGLHAREVVNPDLLVYFAYWLCRAYTDGTDLVIGSTTIGNAIVKMIIENLDLFIFPLVNPDGRSYVQQPGGDAWWRKNRNPNAGLPCKGVDLNRNFDFLWSSGIGTSADSCSQTYKGSAAFSEPETRNVRYLLDTYLNIGYMLDIHSYSQLILYPWGDDHNQSSDPDMNFMNPVYDGLRGTSGAGSYREYIPGNDLNRFALLGNNLRNAIDDERSRVYTVEQGMELYPTTATTGDYAYSRHFADPNVRRVMAFVVETGTQFQPPFAEGYMVIQEVATGLVNFCVNCLCVSETAMLLQHEFMGTELGKQFVELFEHNEAEIIRLTMADEDLRKQAVETLQQVNGFLAAYESGSNPPIPAELVNNVEKLLGRYEKTAGDTLKQELHQIRTKIATFSDRTVDEVFR